MIRVGDTFYMVSTSMHYVPGCPVIKSKDLVNWEMTSYAVDRYDEDPRYDMQGGTLYLNGSWAASIRHHNGRFYVAFCTPYGWGTEKGNFCVCEAEKTEGPWTRTVCAGTAVYSRHRDGPLGRATAMWPAWVYLSSPTPTSLWSSMVDSARW